ncbi:MAG: helix-turn-helix domain-containing protein [Rhodospirillaceae bacterium]
MPTLDTSPDTEQRRHLGAFIRLHRQRMQPDAAGLPKGGRRRTPGLRREELATLCGVSSTWITWLEQGRMVSASAGVLARLAEALHLTLAERSYLFDLAHRRDPIEGQRERAQPPHSVLRSVHAMDCPAYVIDRKWDVLAWNDPAHDLFLGWGERRDAAVPNLLRFLFLVPESRTLIQDWSNRAWRLVAEFRADCGRLADTPPIRSLIEELTATSPEFVRCWQTHDVLDREGGERRFHHPRRGELAFEQLTLRAAVRSDLKLVMLLPPAEERRTNKRGTRAAKKG